MTVNAPNHNCALCHERKAQHLYALPGLTKPVPVCDECQKQLQQEGTEQ